MGLLIGTVFVASLLGSLHCVGMCGPFALLASSNPDKRNAAIVPTVAYSLGRLVTYAVVGLIFGTLGLALNRGTSFANWQQSATYTAGGLMIAVGLIALARQIGVRIKLPTIFAPVQKLLQHAYKRTTQMPPVKRALTIGLLTSLMPCGWLYTFAITAAGTGSPLWGSLLMVAFWAGTVPVMAALMLGFSRIGVSIQHRVPVMMALLVIVLGVFTIGHRAPIGIGAEPVEIVTGTEALSDQISSIDHSQLPCCSSDQE